MNSAIASGLLQLISAAVTPVVLISACAALILGVNNKHTAIADRLRGFAAERRTDVAPGRDRQLAEQLVVFFRRFRLTWMALASLYASIVAFILMILVILLAQKHVISRPGGAIALFLIGITLMLVAVVFETVEVFLSLQSIDIELRDVSGPAKSG